MEDDDVGIQIFIFEKNLIIEIVKDQIQIPKVVKNVEMVVFNKEKGIKNVV